MYIYIKDNGDIIISSPSKNTRPVTFLDNVLFVQSLLFGAFRDFVLQNRPFGAHVVVPQSECRGVSKPYPQRGVPLKNRATQSHPSVVALAEASHGHPIVMLANNLTET
jgi:hypothetical protein